MALVRPASGPVHSGKSRRPGPGPDETLADVWLGAKTKGGVQGKAVHPLFTGDDSTGSLEGFSRMHNVLVQTPY